MHVVGSIIARLGSKRLTYKNLLPFQGKPLVGLGIEILRKAKLVDEIVVSTESELIARVALDFGATVLSRPENLAGDGIPSVPVFQHIVSRYPCDVHVNFNTNFPLCEASVIDRAVELAIENGEALSNPYAAWAQTRDCLERYGDTVNISAHQHEFDDVRAGRIDIHSFEDLLETYRLKQGEAPEGLPEVFCLDSTQGRGPQSR
ncbi:MAG: CMP-N-acetylneuraminic acid synthetase [Candidatus Pelagisphaera sp.]|jgi:CMP-N-acetylneuraminic acid synthetase